MRKLTPLFTLAVAVFLFSGTATGDDKKAKEPCNKKCPISGAAVDDSKFSVVKVEFCCKNCKAKFDKAPGKFLTKVAKGEKGKCIMNGNPAAESSELVVGFCCGNCKAKFDKEPKKFVEKVKVAKKD